MSPSKILRTIPFLLLILAAPARASSTRESLFLHAYETETSERDLDAAVSIYRVIADSAPADTVTVNAQFRAAQCLERLGRNREASESYGRVLALPK